MLEADAEGSTAADDAAALPPAPASQPPQPPPTGANGGGQPSLMMSELREEILKLSLEEKAARLAEVYEDLDVLVKRNKPTHLRQR